MHYPASAPTSPSSGLWWERAISAASTHAAGRSVHCRPDVSIVYRVRRDSCEYWIIQGVGAAMSQVAVAGPAAGRELSELPGPAVVATLGWQWVFYIHIPFVLIVIAVAMLVLQDQRPGQGRPAAQFRLARRRSFRGVADCSSGRAERRAFRRLGFTSNRSCAGGLFSPARWVYMAGASYTCPPAGTQPFQATVVFPGDLGGIPLLPRRLLIAFPDAILSSEGTPFQRREGWSDNGPQRLGYDHVRSCKWPPF